MARFSTASPPPPCVFAKSAQVSGNKKVATDFVEPKCAKSAEEIENKRDGCCEGGDRKAFPPRRGLWTARGPAESERRAGSSENTRHVSMRVMVCQEETGAAYNLNDWNGLACGKDVRLDL